MTTATKPEKTPPAPWTDVEHELRANRHHVRVALSGNTTPPADWTVDGAAPADTIHAAAGSLIDETLSKAANDFAADDPEVAELTAMQRKLEALLPKLTSAKNEAARCKAAVKAAIEAGEEPGRDVQGEVAARELVARYDEAAIDLNKNVNRLFVRVRSGQRLAMLNALEELRGECKAELNGLLAAALRVLFKDPTRFAALANLVDRSVGEGYLEKFYASSK